MQQQDIKKPQEGEKNTEPLDGMVEGGELKQDKSELQKIIDRNKGQVEALDGMNMASKIADEEKIPAENQAEENVPEKTDQTEIAADIKENIPETAENKTGKRVESLDDQVVIAQIPEEKRREILEGLEGKIEKDAPAKTGSAKSDDNQEEVEKHAQEIFSISDPEQQIEKIVQLATSKDPYHAIRVARHLDDNYVLDQVHDRLVEDKVRDELVKKGLLKEI